MIEIEDALIRGLVAGEVDGHDAGSGEMNIFIKTDEPRLAFEDVKRVLAESGLLHSVKAAFRLRSESQYTVLWPMDAGSFRVK